MLTPITVERIKELRLPGFLEALLGQSQNKQCHELAFEERLSLLLEAEHQRRLNQKINRLIRSAKLNTATSLDLIDYSVPRGLNKKLMLELSQGNWVDNNTNIIITGPTGTGKTFIASALAQAMCLQGRTVRFERSYRWLTDFKNIFDQGRFHSAMTGYRKIKVAVFDEWMRDPLTPLEARCMHDFIDDHAQHGSIIFVSQLPVLEWHIRFPDPTIAEAILDRLVHSSIRIDLSGESMRKIQASRTSYGKKETSLRSEKE